MATDVNPGTTLIFMYTAPNVAMAIRQRNCLELSKFPPENHDWVKRIQDRLIPDQQWETACIRMRDARPYSEHEFIHLLARLHTSLTLSMMDFEYDEYAK